MPGTVPCFISVISFDANKRPEAASILQMRSPRQDDKPGPLTTSQFGLAGHVARAGGLDPEWVVVAGAPATCQALLLRPTLQV